MIARVVRNLRPHVDANTCGQAAVATMLAAHDVAPFTWPAFTDGEAIDSVLRSFPPDVPFGLGTSVWRITAALRGFGIAARRINAGPFGRGADRAFQRLRDHVGSGRPAVVCIDTGLLGRRAWTAHWAAVLGVSDGIVRLGNMDDALATLDRDRFMRAWRCRHLPYPHNCCAVLCGPGQP